MNYQNEQSINSQCTNKHDINNTLKGLDDQILKEENVIDQIDS